jgi:CHAD domain-containing protein
MNARTSSTTAFARATPPSQPWANFRALLLDALSDRWRTFRAELKRCQKHSSEEAVHDLRVATRRLIATVKLVASVYPEARLRKARRALKKQLDMLGPLRDVQVQLLSIEKMLPSFPELRGFYNFLMRRERILAERLDAEVKAVKIGKVEWAIRAAINQLAVLHDPPETQQQKLTEAVHAVELAFKRVVERRQAVDPSDSPSIHRMRVAFKKFRYMVESLAPMLDRVSSRHLKAMNAFQGSMGDIQDAEVLITTLMAFVRRHGVGSGAAFGRALEELGRRRTALIDVFLGSADDLFTFWEPIS